MAVCVSLAEEECSRQGWSLFVLADSRVILLPIGVMDTVPLRLAFPLFKMICQPRPRQFLNLVTSQGAEREHVCPTSDRGESSRTV